MFLGRTQIAVAALMAFPMAARAAVAWIGARIGDWYVDGAANCATATGSAEEPFCTIAAALAVALDGDAIHVAPGKYVENLAVAVDVALIGEGGAASTIVDGADAGAVVDIASHRTVRLEGLTLQHGRAPLGAGIHAESGGDLALVRCVVQQNVAIDASGVGDEQGGGIAIAHGALAVDDCQILDNVSGDEGGGLFNDGGTIVVTNSLLRGNRAGDSAFDFGSGNGGAIYSRFGSLTLADSTLESNQAGDLDHAGSPTLGSGGAISSVLGAVTIEDCDVANSSASVHGGALDDFGSTLTLVRTSIRSSRAGYDGGGALLDGSQATLDACDVVDNRASDTGEYGQGGAIKVVGAAATFTATGCTFSGNDALGAGGGLFDDGGAITLARCVVSGNSATTGVTCEGGGIALGSGSLALADCALLGNRVAGAGTSRGGGLLAWSGLVTLVRCSVAGNASDDPTNGASAGSGGGIHVGPFAYVALDHTVVAGNAAQAARDVDGDVASLGHVCIGDTSGGTITGDPTGNLLDVDPQFADAATGDYTLAATSPCLDAGDPSLTPSGMDVAGDPRLLDGDFDRVMVVDLGAFEFDHVHLVVTGTPVLGGTLTLATTGKAGLPVLMFLGTGLSELPFPRFGALFVDLGQPWLIVPWSTIPSSFDVDVDPTLPVPLTVYLQELALDGATRSGNFGNLVTIAIE